jgi:hypothetical protein
MSLSLYVIEDALQQLVDAYAVAAEDQDIEALKVLDAQIADYLKQEATKIDSGCALLRQGVADAAMLRQEGERLIARSKLLEDRDKRIKQVWCEAMAAHGIKELKSQHNTIRRSGNGGVPPLELPGDIANIPDHFRKLSVTLSLDLWRALLDLPWPVIEGARYEVARPEADTGAIRAAIATGKEVPGCRLGERGEHLRVS